MKKSNYWWRWDLAVICSFIIITLDYIISNFSFPFLDESESLNWVGFLYPNKVKEERDEIFFVNTGLDKTLVPKYDGFGDLAGYIPITDRVALTRFLDIAEKSDPRFILLDIRFENGLVTDSDSALFSKIKGYPKIVFSDHRDMAPYTRDISLYMNSAMADYRAHMFSGFSRYEFLQDGRESVALRLYRIIDGGDFQKHGLIYRSGEKIAYNMQFIPLPLNLADSLGDNGLERYPYLTSGILNRYSEEALKERLKDKIVIIGDFDNDIHDSYMGSIPGPLIHYYAYRLLREGGQRVNLWYVLILFIVYTCISFYLLGPEEEYSLSNRLGIKSPAAKFMFSLLGWGTVLFLLKILLYLWLGISFIASVPTVVFTVIIWCKTYLHLRHTRSQISPTQ